MGGYKTMLIYDYIESCKDIMIFRISMTNRGCSMRQRAFDLSTRASIAGCGVLMTYCRAAKNARS
ncbi:hypothetical protein A2U01_0083784, partial [Trifolium medium]|nr:hypothetical protein [Trifolium medium]